MAATAYGYRPLMMTRSAALIPGNSPIGDQLGQGSRHPGEEAIGAERRQIVETSQGKLTLGRSPTPAVQTEIDDCIQGMHGDNLATAYEVLVEAEGNIAELREALGLKAPGAEYRLWYMIQALRLGVLPTLPSRASQVQRKLRNFPKPRFGMSLSAEAKEYLNENERQLDTAAVDAVAQAAEEAAAIQAEAAHIIHFQSCGVYAFTYPHYLRHPTRPSESTERQADRTLIKIGSSARDMRERIDEIANQTAAPEPRRVLRLYRPRDAETNVRDIERTFHQLLDAAGHGGPRRSSIERQFGGTEWFETSAEFLDAIAVSLDLQIVDLEALES